MIVPFKSQKTYGVLHTENYFSFLGFSKKVNSDEIQKVDVYLDDVVIHTIIADKHLQKIEDIYELEGFGFEYILPHEYIGQKSAICFKNHETQENLQNSPYELIKENHPKFNEMAFLNSVENPINEEKIKNIYCPNSIGFLATEENLEDEEFISYITQIIKDFSSYKFKILFINDDINTLLKEKFQVSDFESIKISSIYDICKNLEVYLSNYERLKYSNPYETHIIRDLRKFSTDVITIGLSINMKNISIKEHEFNNTNHFNKLFDNLEILGFTKKDIEKYGNTYYEMYFKKASEQYAININFDLNEKVSKAHIYWNLKLGLNNHEFFKYSIDFAKKFTSLK